MEQTATEQASWLSITASLTQEDVTYLSGRVIVSRRPNGLRVTPMTHFSQSKAAKNLNVDAKGTLW
jgi:hypothetical protein